MSLPYDATPPPEDRVQPTADDPIASPPLGVDAGASARAVDAALDRPLDEYTPAVPSHVQDLIGRMGQGKVYLLEESPGVLHLNQEQRIRGDPRIAALADQLDAHDPSDWLVAASAGSSSPLRNNALFIQSELIKHLSTSKVFGWVTSLGAGVMGIEWLNDTTLHLIFPSAAAALLALSLMSKAGFDPAEGDDPLVERAAHSVPWHLLPQAGLEPEDRQAGVELLGGRGPGAGAENGGVVKRGRGQFRGEGESKGLLSDHADNLVADDESAHGIRLAPGVDPAARITVRFALEGDKSARARARESEWYQRHGRGAGKEVAAGARRGVGRGERGRDGEREGEGWGWDGGASDGRESGRELLRRIGRERRGPYARPEGGRGERGGSGRERRTVDELDKELERFARQKAGLEGDGEMDVDGVGGEAPREREGRGNRRETRGRDDLDKGESRGAVFGRGAQTRSWMGHRRGRRVSEARVGRVGGVAEVSGVRCSLLPGEGAKRRGDWEARANGRRGTAQARDRGIEVESMGRMSAQGRRRRSAARRGGLDAWAGACG